MTNLLHRDPDETEFDRRLRLSHLRCLAGSEAASASPAENCLGFSEPGASRIAHEVLDRRDPAGSVRPS
ncbi:hypothetical protein ACFYY1_27820 [Streptomyces sp. NPDC001890]|uniref:hypothetical protein n=1 Tax=Streptomyces sp. NPDC001890 TaxID=3364620 RepID=UPI0036BC0E6A